MKNSNFYVVLKKMFYFTLFSCLSLTLTLTQYETSIGLIQYYTDIELSSKYLNTVVVCDTKKELFRYEICMYNIPHKRDEMKKKGYYKHSILFWIVSLQITLLIKYITFFPRLRYFMIRNLNIMLLLVMRLNLI